MTNMFRTLALLLSAAIVPSLAVHAAERTPEIVATIPDDGLMENLIQMPDGAFLITSAYQKVIWRVDAAGKVDKFMTLPDYAIILGIAPLGEGFAVGALRRTFTAGAGYDLRDVGSELVLVDKAGAVTGKIAAEKGAAFNGIGADGRGGLLIADSHLPMIWHFDPATKQIEPWLKDDAFVVPEGRFGANGVRVLGDVVYITNEAVESVYRVRRGPDGKPQGGATFVTKIRSPDDFAIAPDGTIYMPPPYPTKSDDKTPFMRISPSGEVTTFLADAPFGTSALISKDGKWVYWPTSVTGGVADHHQRLLRMAIP